MMECIIVLPQHTAELHTPKKYKYIHIRGISGERLDEHVFVTFFPLSESWQRIGYADRILSMVDTAQLSQCSWSVIEKVITAREIELRKFRGKDIKKYTFFPPFLRRRSGIGFSMGKTISEMDTVQLFLCIREITEKVIMGCHD